MKKELYKMIEFPSHDTKNGLLTMVQDSTVSSLPKLPFDIKKVLVIKGMKKSDVRGGHTHHKTNQIIFCISGKCAVNLENRKQKKKVLLDKHNVGLVLYPYVWHTMEDFDENTSSYAIENFIYYHHTVVKYESKKRT